MENVIQMKMKKMVPLRTLHWKVLWGTRNVSSVAKPDFGTFIFKSKEPCDNVKGSSWNHQC